MDDQESVPNLIHCLSKLHLHKKDSSVADKLIANKLSWEQRLKRKAFNALFNYLKRNEKRQRTSKSSYELSTEEELSVCCFNLRHQRCYDDALKLEQLINALSNQGKIDEQVKPAVKFLLCLKDMAESLYPDAIGHSSEYQHHAYTKQGASAVSDHLGNVRIYGATKLDLPMTNRYMHYPSDVFVRPAKNAIHQVSRNYPLVNDQIFSMKPGLDCKDVKVVDRNSYEYKTAVSLFGALIKSGAGSLDIHLELPDLPGTVDHAALDLKIPRVMEFAEDEGFVDAVSSSGYSSQQSPVSSINRFSVDIWDDALNHKVIKCHRWEMVGSFVKNRERPFLSEAGSEAFDQIYCYHQYQLKMMDSSLHISPVHTISSKQLINDLRNVLIAVPSHSFHLDQHQGKFYVREGLCLFGISPLALRNICGLAVQCGSDFLWLNRFAEARQPSCIESFSLVLESFRSAIRNYLQHFIAYILSIPLLATILEFLNTIRKSVNQMRFLVQLCVRAINSEENESISTGRHLLSYLYDECLAMDGSEHQQLLLSLLKTTCTPYMTFIHDWVFYGICKDDYNEFMIQANDDHLRTRDCYYWNKAFTLVDKDPSRTTPAFIAEIASDVFLCGKSLNLLKLCKPMHFLFMEEQNNLPELHLTFSSSDLLQLEKNSQIYLGRMQAVARQFSITRQDLNIQAEKAKQELMAQAHKAAADELKQLHEQIVESRRNDDKKKRRFFVQLKEQLEQKTKRVEEERAKEKAEDKARIESATKQELLEAAVDAEIERQTREELVQYYAKLSEDAVLREQRALWRVRRHKFDQKRLNFLQADELQIQKLQQSNEEKSATAESDALSELFHSSSLDLDPQWIPTLSEQEYVGASSIHDASENKLAVSGNESDVLTLPLVSDSIKGALPTVEIDEDDMRCSISNGISSEPVKKEDILATDNGNKILLENASLNMITRDLADIESEKENPLVAKQHLTAKESQDSSDKIVVESTVEATSRKQETGSGQKTHLKMNSNMNAVTQTVQAKERYHIKMVSEKHSSLQSKEYDGRGRQHLKMNSIMNATKSSEETLPKIKKQNVFGHVSQVSRLEFDVPAPRLKKNENLHAAKVSEWDEFANYQIRPHRRKAVDGQSVDRQTSDDSSLMPRSHIKMNSLVNAQTESEFVDVERLRTERFRLRNVHGHSSNSSVQHLLYRDKHSENEIPDKVKEESGDMNDDRFQQFWADTGAEQYTLEYSNLDDFSVVDVMPRMKNISSSNKKDLELSDFVSLPLFIKRSLMSPLSAQISLVNQSTVNYFMVELEIENHFAALQKFLLLQDGEFSQSLCHQLFSKISSSEKAKDVLNPMFLNSILHKAIAASLFGESKFSNAVSFTLKPLPRTIHNSGLNVLDYLVITYKIDWPLNIVITENCLEKYAKIFNFMMKLRHAIWLLNAIFHKLKRDARVHCAGSSAEMKKLQLYRHEMQHFAKVIEEYIASQVIHVSWHEFQEDLGSKINNLDDLIHCHVSYLNKCIARCLLNQNTSSVMKIMQDTFGLILKFNNQLVSQSWQKDVASNRIYHPAFNSLCESFQAFHSQSSFLFKVVRNIAERHYQPHFHDLLVRLGFNEFYKLDQYALQS